MTTLVFDSPRPSTRSTMLIETSASITGPGSLRRHHDVDVADHLGEAAQRAAVGGVRHAGHLAQALARCAARAAARSEIGVRSSERSRVEAGERARELLLGLRAEALELAHAGARPAPGADRRSTVTPSSLRSFASALGPRPWMRSSATTLAGCFWRSASSFCDPARLEQLADLLGGALADALDLLELLERELPEVGALRGDRLRRGLVGAHPERLRIAPRRSASARRARAASRARPASNRPRVDDVAFPGWRRKTGRSCSSIAGREVRITHPGKLVFSREARLSKLELVHYYLSVADGALRGIRDRPHGLEALRARRRGRGLLPEARARAAARVAAHRDALLSLRPHRRGGGGRRCGRARLDREPRLPRAASARGALRRSRASRRAADRSRSDARRAPGPTCAGSRSR